MRIRKGFKTHLMKTDAKYVNTSYIADRLDANYYSDKYLVIEQQIKNSGYKVVKYHDICDVIKCGPFGSSVLAENYNDTGIIMIRPLNLKEVLLSEDELVRFPEESLGTDFPVFEAGDILFARVGTPSCSIIPNSIEKVTISPNIIASKLKKTINKYYVALFLNTDYGLNQLERRFKAVSQPTISTDEIKTIDIVLPDVHIQNYIGNKVRKAEELREEAKWLKEELYEVINKLFPILSNNEERKYNFVIESLVNSERLDPDYYSSEHIAARVALSKFQTIKLKDIAYITDGDHGTPEFKKEGVKFLRNKNVGEFIVDYSDLVYIDKAYEEKYLKSSRLQAKDILLTKIGSIGRSAIFLDGEANLNANSALIRITHDKFSPYFLCVLFNSNLYQIIFNKEAGGAVQSALSLNRLGEIPIPIISQEIQSDIEQKLKRFIDCTSLSTQLINEAKQDVEDLIEGKFDESKISEGV